MLRACAEIHVLLTITTAFVMKMPNDVMVHEKLSIDGFYDWVCLRHFSMPIRHSSASDSRHDCVSMQCTVLLEGCERTATPGPSRLSVAPGATELARHLHPAGDSRRRGLKIPPRMAGGSARGGGRPKSRVRTVSVRAGIGGGPAGASGLL